MEGNKGYLTHLAIPQRLFRTLQRNAASFLIDNVYFGLRQPWAVCLTSAIGR